MGCLPASILTCFFLPLGNSTTKSVFELSFRISVSMYWNCYQKQIWLKVSSYKNCVMIPPSKSNFFFRDLTCTKEGQVFSKCLFDVFNFFQKTNENKLRYHSSKIKFVHSFFGRKIVLKKSFWLRKYILEIMKSIYSTKQNSLSIMYLLQKISIDQ